jgi:hypothetical protein
VLIVVVPGIGGSVLSQTGTPTDVVWNAGAGSVAGLGFAPGRLSLNRAPRLEPVGLISTTTLLGFTVVTGYESLLTMLAEFGPIDDRGDPAAPRPGARVVAAPYDFRLGVADAARRLDAVVSTHLKGMSEAQRTRHVVVVAHSMGGLVARYWLGVMGRWRCCRALVTLGTPHRGAPKALQWMVNGVLGGVLAGPTGLLREWPSVAELLPRYRAVRDIRSGQLCYPHDLRDAQGRSLAVLSGAAAAFGVHREIEDAWNEMPGTGPEMVSFLGWSHPTLDDAVWDGKKLLVSKRPPPWMNRTGWERDFGDGTVPAVSAVPIEKSNDQNSLNRVRDRHMPMVNSARLVQLLRRYDSRDSLDWIRGDGSAVRPPTLGLDVEEIHPAGAALPIQVIVREAPDEVSGARVVAGLRPTGDDTTEPVEISLEWDGEVFRGAFPSPTPGLYEVTVVARSVPRAGRLTATDTVAVVAA